MKLRYAFSQVDAFTQTPFHGNPCAVVMDAEDLTDREMLLIAREMNLSETSFVLSSSKADFKFRYFTPAEEIPLAGHPTIATVHRLLELGLIAKQTSQVSIELPAGIIDVFIHESENGTRITMRQLPPKFDNVYAPEMVLPLFGLHPNDVKRGFSIQTVSTGTPMLMIPLEEASALDRIQFAANEFAVLRKRADFFSAHLFYYDANRNRSEARHFCPPPDVLEDPFTGSATGSMACYLRKYKLMKGEEFEAHQGRHLGRPGQAFVKVLGTNEQMSGVEVGGYAVTVLSGEIVSPSIK